MKLQISTANEYNFYPDTVGTDDNGNEVKNRDLPEKERFTIVLRRVNSAIEGANWFKGKEASKMKMDNGERIRSHIKRIENPPFIEVDGKEGRELTIEDLLNQSYVALYSITEGLSAFINDMSDGEDDVKK